METNVNNMNYNTVPKLVFVRFATTIASIPASSSVGVTREMFGFFVPTGYRPLGLVEFSVDAAHVIPRQVDAFDDPIANENMMILRNLSSSAYTNIPVCCTYSFIENTSPWAKDTDIVYYDRHYYTGTVSLTWGDLERDLPENAGVLLTMENAGPVTSS